MSHSKEHDNHMGCTDFSHMGGRCPLYVAGVCHFNGEAYPENIPLDGVCDKKYEAIDLYEVIRLGTMDMDQWEAAQDVWKSENFRTWAAVQRHYELPLKVRKSLEEEVFYSRMGRMSKRTFHKKFKPRDVGVADGSTFRTRVLDYLTRPRFAGRDGTEIVALRITSTYPSDLTFEFFTKGSTLERTLSTNGVADSPSVKDLLRKYEGLKILVEWSWSVRYRIRKGHGEVFTSLKFMKNLEK